MRKQVLILLLVGILAFIWGNSALSSVRSNHISDQVTSVVGGELTHTDAEEAAASRWLTSGHIRKIAHASEFAALGVVVTLLSAKRKGAWTGIALAGVLIALTDETIQIFTGRTSAVKDVWIDFGGFLLGYLLLCLYRKKRAQKHAP